MEFARTSCHVNIVPSTVVNVAMITTYKASAKGPVASARAVS